jgi:hypothetical protein
MDMARKWTNASAKNYDHLKPEESQKRGRPRKTWNDGIFTDMSERGLRIGEWNNRRQWNMEDGRRHQKL